jgi:hypothetical protein
MGAQIHLFVPFTFLMRAVLWGAVENETTFLPKQLSKAVIMFSLNLLFLRVEMLSSFNHSLGKLVLISKCALV